MDLAPASKTRHDARTLLNHIAGYSDILRADCGEAGLTELKEIFSSIFGLVSALKDSLAGLFGDEPLDERKYANLRSSILSQLFDVISLGHSARRIANRDERKEFLPDIDKILESSDKIVDLVERPDEAIESMPSPLRESDMKRASGRERADLGAAPITGRILIIDDNETNRHIMTRQLERQNHIVVTVEDGKEALRLLKRVPFDVIILDMLMPEMSGFEVLKALKADDRLRDMPVIVISALENPTAMATCIELGAEDYLPREFDPIILRARIGSIMERSRLRKQKDLYVAAIIEAQQILKKELAEAARYVGSLLPPPMETATFRLAWSFIPSLSLGGDIFGYHFLADDTFALYLIDVSGHGIQAALLSVSIMNMLKSETLANTDFSDPSDVLTTLNAHFRSEEQNNMYFTIWYGVFDPVTRRLTYASGGNSAGVSIAADGARSVLQTEGIVIGVDETASFGNACAVIPPGSRLYVFSDGIYEVRTKAGEVFGMDELIDVLAKLPTEALASDRLDVLLELIRDISLNGAFEDDVSLVEMVFT